MNYSANTMQVLYGGVFRFLSIFDFGALPINQYLSDISFVLYVLWHL